MQRIDRAVLEDLILLWNMIDINKMCIIAMRMIKKTTQIKRIRDLKSILTHKETGLNREKSM